jgi:hypothetical protein
MIFDGCGFIRGELVCMGGLFVRIEVLLDWTCSSIVKWILHTNISGSHNIIGLSICFHLLFNLNYVVCRWYFEFVINLVCLCTIFAWLWLKLISRLTLLRFPSFCLENVKWFKYLLQKVVMAWLLLRLGKHLPFKKLALNTNQSINQSILF